MQEIESKRKLRASEGAHFFFTLIFLSASGIIKLSKEQRKCHNIDLSLLVDLTFYGLIIWATYLLISIVPRYKNPAIKIFFNFLDLCFGVYLFVLFVFANKLYFSTGFAQCYTEAPVQAFFTELFLYVTYVLFIVVALALVTFVSRRFLRNQPEEAEELDDD
jgi:hypothetical protein